MLEILLVKYLLHQRIPRLLKANTAERSHAIKSLQENKKCVLEVLPECAKFIPSKWVYGLKLQQDGSIDMLKPCFVIKGFAQREGIDLMKRLVLFQKCPI